MNHNYANRASLRLHNTYHAAALLRFHVRLRELKLSSTGFVTQFKRKKTSWYSNGWHATQDALKSLVSDPNWFQCGSSYGSRSCILGQFGSGSRSSVLMIKHCRSLRTYSGSGSNRPKSMRIHADADPKNAQKQRQLLAFHIFQFNLYQNNLSEDTLNTILQVLVKGNHN